MAGSSKDFQWSYHVLMSVSVCVPCVGVCVSGGRSACGWLARGFLVIIVTMCWCLCVCTMCLCARLCLCVYHVLVCVFQVVGLHMVGCDEMWQGF